MAGEQKLHRLWAPWRMEYIRRAEAAASTRAAKKPAERRARPGRAGATGSGLEEPGCLFCRIRRTRRDRADLVLTRRPHAFLMLNRFPYNPAHLMVAVARHAAQFADLEAEEWEELVGLTALAERALEAEYRPHGVNYGANVGRVAGAGFPGHLHLHLVPRWNGDTNFMPVVGGTKVLPESLGRTWTRLRRTLGAFEARSREAGRVRRR